MDFLCLHFRISPAGNILRGIDAREADKLLGEAPPTMFRVSLSKVKLVIEARRDGAKGQILMSFVRLRCTWHCAALGPRA